MKALIILFMLPLWVIAQNPVVTNFPSLAISGSGRGWSMGDNGIASSVSNQSQFYNIARSAYQQHFHAASVSYQPWLPGISNDARFMNASYLASVGSSSAFGFAINSLSLGSVALRNDYGATIGLYKSSEYNIAGSYALQLSSNHSLGVALRFIGQDLQPGIAKSVYSFCGDIGYYGQIPFGSSSSLLQWGAVVRNLGPNINLPSTAGVGIAYQNTDQSGNQFTVSLDASRLLKEEWKALHVSAGAEYGFNEQFFLRGGVSLENKMKGNRKFFSFGAGYKGFVSDQSWGLDIHYLVPFGTATAASPFQNAYGITLSLNLGSFQ